MAVVRFIAEVTHTGLWLVSLGEPAPVLLMRCLGIPGSRAISLNRKLKPTKMLPPLHSLQERLRNAPECTAPITNISGCDYMTVTWPIKTSAVLQTAVINFVGCD